jgi:hypothetical protein
MVTPLPPHTQKVKDVTWGIPMLSSSLLSGQHTQGLLGVELCLRKDVGALTNPPFPHSLNVTLADMKSLWGIR